MPQTLSDPDRIRKRNLPFGLIYVLILFLFVGAGCVRDETPDAVTVDQAPDAVATAPVPAPDTGQATETSAFPNGATSSPPPTETFAPLPSSTVIPSPSATPRHPLDIEAMRQQSYPGSDLIIEQSLDPGPSYERLVVSYLSEGNKIYALLTIPHGARPESGWPVVIFNHGYVPPHLYRTTERYEAYVDAFARNGYIVFRSDYRGHGNSEGNAYDGYSTPAYTVDVLNGMASVLRHPDADPERVGMWGHSMGGQITLRAMVVTDQIDAGVIWAGVIASYPDLIDYWPRPGPTGTPDPDGTRRSWRQEFPNRYGAPDENPAFWAAISPNSFVSEISGPIQLHHGTADQDVPTVLSEILFAELQAEEIPAEYYTYEGDDHNIANNLGLALGRSVQFFDRYVKETGAD